MKVDALDHHADHFFPGVQDAGWDLAAAVFEDVAYPAFRLGYASLACESVRSDTERARFAQVAARCRDRLMSPSAP